MLISNLELLRHIQEETNFILQNTIEKTNEQVINDNILCRAIVRSLEIIGEASAKPDDEFKAMYPHIEWKKMSGARNPADTLLFWCGL